MPQQDPPLAGSLVDAPAGCLRGREAKGVIPSKDAGGRAGCAQYADLQEGPARVGPQGWSS